MILGVLLRVVLNYTPLPAVLARRPELSSPVTSIRSLNEGVFLARHGLDPYDGGVFAHSPLYLHLFRVIPAEWLVWVLVDVAAAYALQRIRGKHAATLYLFNPYIILSNLARSTTSIDNALVLGAISLAYHGSVLSGVLLALAAYTSLYPILLLPPVLLMQRRKAFTGAAFIATLGTCLTLGHQHWRVILTVSDLAPNVGMWWYFFTEMFDHFRAFFLGVFQLHTLIYVAPVCIRLRHQPLLATLVLVGVISTWKSYPTLGDLGLWAGLLGCFPEIVKELRHPLFTTTVYLYTLILLPLLHSLWLLTGTGNANFFYAATMVHGLNSCLAIVDVLAAGMRLNVMRIPWKANWTAVQFTGIQ